MAIPARWRSSSAIATSSPTSWSRRRVATSWRCSTRSTSSRHARRGRHQARRRGNVAARAGLRRAVPQHRDRIDGVLVCLPNFGDEKGVADVLRLSALNVPVLVQACPDDLDQLTVQRRRDAFCGKISVCNNLRQYGIPFSLTERHTLGLTIGRVQAGAAEVSRRLPRRPRHAQRADRRDWRPAECVQHDALQRKALRGQRHQRQHARSVRSARRRRAGSTTATAG